MNKQVAVLGGGCFWCLEAVFLDLDGVLAVESGYAGGNTRDPTYEEVCSGETGHAEVVRVEFDADQISFHDLLGVFFLTHDPTTLNRQGNDIGTQYRSVIYYVDEAQRAEAAGMIDALTAKRVFDRPVVTELSALPDYYAAEDYHQRFFERNPFQGYCMAVVGPKVAKFRKQFASRLKKRA
ncbi:MAG: peptide-methionine (S)-S-oxide reductase MsrA [Quisquiliibacterium sp.]|jgi:peptide-methionine (S)-S-oxide reductase